MLKISVSRLLNNADVKLSFFFMAAGSILLALSLTMMDSLLIVQVAVTLVMASAIYLLLRWARRRKQAEANYDNDKEEEEQHVSLFPSCVNQMLDIAFWGLLIAAMFMLTQGVYARPLAFLLLTSGMAAVLAVQVFDGRNTGYCLFKIVIIGILLRASAYYQFPSIIGSDSVVELNSFRQLLESGHLGDFMGSYQNYHTAFLFNASASYITGLEGKDAYFVLAVIEVVSLLFVYLIGKDVFNSKVGLLAALLVILMDWHIFWGFWGKAMTLSIAWLPMLLYVVLEGWRRRGSLRFSLISIVLLFIIILTHPFASAIVLAVIATFWVVFFLNNVILKKQEYGQPVSWALFLLAFCATLAYWMYVSRSSLNYIGYAIEYAFSFDAGSIAKYELGLSPAVLNWQKLPMLLLVFFSIVGCIVVFNIKKLDRKTVSRINYALVSGAIVLLALVLFYMPTFGALESMRWFVFMGIILAIPAAKGLLSIIGKNAWWGIVLFLLVFGYSGVMTTSHTANIEAVIPWDQQRRDAFTSSEMAAAETAIRMAGIKTGQETAKEPVLYADHFYTLHLEYEQQVPYEDIIDASELFKAESLDYDGILLLRQAVTEVITITYDDGHGYYTMSQSQYDSLVEDPQSSLVYDNGVVKALYK